VTEITGVLRRTECVGIPTKNWTVIDQFKSLVEEKYNTPQEFIDNIILDGYKNHLELMEDLVDPKIFSKAYTRDIAAILDSAEYFDFKRKDQTICRKIVWSSRNYQHHYRSKIWKSNVKGQFRSIKYNKRHLWHPMQKMTDEFPWLPLEKNKNGYYNTSDGQREFEWVKNPIRTSST